MRWRRARLSNVDPVRAQNPLFRREAASDPLFDPIGGYKRVDTKGAPVFLDCVARRQGATNLEHRDPSSGSGHALRRLRLKRETRLLLVGTRRFPKAVEQELVVDRRIEEVFRVWGRNRFETASKNCCRYGNGFCCQHTLNALDENGSDGVYSACHFTRIRWLSIAFLASECALLQNTVVIADGLQGVDALTAGWWTSYWSVPVLLHDGSAKT
jgi:hypothetical protein